MQIGTVDIIYIIIIFQLLIFSIFLFVRRAGSISNYLLGIQLISQAAGIFAGFSFSQSQYFYSVNPTLFFIGSPFRYLWGPTFFLYVKSAAYSDFKLKKIDMLHFMPFFIIVFYLLISYFPLSNDAKRQIISSGDTILFQYWKLFDYFVRLQVLTYILFSIFTLRSVKLKLKESFSSISKTNYAWLKFIVVGFAAAYFLSIPFLIYWYIYQSDGLMVNLATILIYFTYFNLIFFKAWYQPELFAGIEENVKYKSSKLTSDEAEGWIKKLESYIRINKPYLNPDLSLNQLADNIQIPPRILSQIINENYKQNFQDYINRLRVEESKKYLVDTKGKKTVLEILYEVGFNTKSAYNIAFKKTTGITPTEYRKKFSFEPEVKTKNIIF